MILILIAAVFMWFFLTDRIVKGNSSLLNVKRFLVVLIAGMAFTKIGRSAVFLVAVLILFTLFLIKKKNGINV